MQQYFALFRQRNFMYHWMAGAISNIGDFLNYLALVKLLSDNPAHLGTYLALIMIAKVVPGVVLAPVAGVLADRLPRRTIMMAADLVRAALVTALVFVEHPAAIIGLVTLSAMAAAFYNPASSAMLPSLVSKEQLVTAGSLNVMTQRMAMLLGNGIGAAVLMAVGPHNVFYIDAVSFVVSAVFVAMIAVPAPASEGAAAPAQARAGFVADLREALSFIRGTADVRNLLISMGLASVADSGLNVLLVTFFTVSLGLAAENLGYVWALFGGASVLGALGTGVLGNRLGWRRLVPLGAAYIWVTMMGALAMHSVVPSVTFLTLLGLGSGMANVGVQAAVGELVPDHVRGRVFAAWGMLQNLIFVAGAMAAGVLSDRIGPARTLMGYTSFFLIAAVYAFVVFRTRPGALPAPAAAAAGTNG